VAGLFRIFYRVCIHLGCFHNNPDIRFTLIISLL
jgi:hypothetical protein